MKRGILSAAIITALNIGGPALAGPLQQNTAGAPAASSGSFQRPSEQAPQATGPTPRPATQAAPNAEQLPPATSTASSSQSLPAPPRHALTTVVLDPGHGGSDTGARGANGVVEKDVALIYARAAKIELEKLGFHVVMTRQADEDPSFDDRATIANAQRDAVFLTLHVSSTGPIGTVRTYFYDSDQSSPPIQSALSAANLSGGSAVAVPASSGLKPVSATDSQASTPSSSPSDLPAAPPPHGFVFWDQAQQSYVNESHQLADLIQGEMATTFKDSQPLAIPVPERDLRSVAVPAVAVEVSSVDVADPLQLTSMAGNLGQAIAHAVAAFRPIYEQDIEAGAKN
jgi:N-acetylmuramoyl-L-alanine amidase